MDLISIITDIMSLMQKHGGPNKSWYVGISQDARDMLFSRHNISESTGIWIFREADSSYIARKVEDYFVNNFRTDGNPGEGASSSYQVYAFKKTPDTIP